MQLLHTFVMLLRVTGAIEMESFEEYINSKVSEVCDYLLVST